MSEPQVRWRDRIMFRTPVALAFLFAIVLIVQLAGEPATSRILVMCTDPVPKESISNTYKGGPAPRADIILVVEVNSKDRVVTCTQIPRDTLAFIGPRIGQDKVNCSIGIAGASRSRDVVGRLVGLHIDHYVVISIRDFMRFTEIIGGIEMPVDASDDEGGTPVSSSTERQRSVLLKDLSALDYVRSRPGSDLDRERRQQRFLGVVNRQCRSLGTAEMCRLAAWAWNLDGDISPVQMAVYSRAMLRSKRVFRSLDTTSIYLNGVSYLLPVGSD